MTINKNDLRYKQTDEKIRKEFIKLLQTIGYHKITISKLISKTQINRSTFYDHFLDKEDLMKQLQIDLIVKLTDNLPEINVYNLDNKSIVDERIETIINRVYVNKEFFKLYFSEKSDGLFFNRFSNFSEKLLIQTDLIENIVIPEVYVFSMIESVMINLIQSWIKRNFMETPEEFSKIISKILPDIFKSLIR
ncbi:transcriptional regulator [Leuconostoc litchii]|uniref:TetR/AcrR family transcriptional regulator n=1 Tax=Leuconostoc litchii TaxID=1981069 RepID=A0A6P2CM09_9LACO|nr:TetR/AcrR family transcriptional regulator [Leuconostoc litchii]TYC47030.1 TetR/AcrR family transcriptional regulator [Leuconostoc litchii]GMA68952.1 transcriptional regulator [Leuconostoc litchii]